MRKKTEKIYEELEKFLNENGNEKENHEELINTFIKKYNKNIAKQSDILTEKTAKTSDDFLELAQEIIFDDEDLALKYAKKALSLNKENLDAELMIAQISAINHIDMVQKLKKILTHAEEIMMKKGYMTEEHIGDFWLLWETRPFMRIKNSYINALVEASMMKSAIFECEDMLRLCQSDNLGIRYKLMALYTYFEDEENAIKLYEKFDSSDENQFLLSLSILYFKKGDFAKSTDFLRKLQKTNKDTKKFFKNVYNNGLFEYIEIAESSMYSPYSEDELALLLTTNSFLYIEAYIDWAHKTLNQKLK